MCLRIIRNRFFLKKSKKVIVSFYLFFINHQIVYDRYETKKRFIKNSNILFKLAFLYFARI